MARHGVASAPLAARGLDADGNAVSKTEGVHSMAKAALVPALAEHEPPAVSESAAIIQVIERAARDPSVNVEKMERLYAMHERAMATRARAAYSTALAEMQTELPIIAERGRINIGSGKPQMYALWEDINEGIKPVLSRHGFAISLRTGRQDDKLTVTGVLSHRDG